MLLLSVFLLVTSLSLQVCSMSHLRQGTISAAHNQTAFTPPQHRSLHEASHLAYYNKPAMTFLHEYGLQFHLYDQFFREELNKTGRIVQSKNIPAETGKFKEKYKVRSYDSFRTWGIATATPKPEYRSLEFVYKPSATSDEMISYNNMFRYGPSPDERFMWIGFDRDPWTESAPDAPAMVHFVGHGTALPNTFHYTCAFRTPKALNSTVLVSRFTREAHPIVKCAIPFELTRLLSEEMTEIVLDLVRTPASSPGNEAPVSEPMLTQIRVPRLHELDRRHFQHTIHTMVVVLDDILVTEWIVYNIMLGMEHFYIYYNAKVVDFSIENSILRPFLDANIVTLIYYPFLHTVHYMHAQYAGLNAFIRGYGRYAGCVGFWDVDEFFLPNSNFLPYLQQPPVPYTAPIVPLVTAKLGGWNVSAIMFDTVEMDCAESSTNYYPAGNNLLVAATSGEIIREAVTTHCTRRGYRFRQSVEGHGKMLVWPTRVDYVKTPHTYYQHIVRTTEQDALFRHFNRLRYTRQLVRFGNFSMSMITADDTLRVFTLASLRDLLGITYTYSSEADGSK